MAFDETPSQRVDQSQLFTEPGQVYTLNGTIADPSEPFRVLLAWTDAPGTTTGNAWVNDLNLEVLFLDVEGDYLLYHGNHFLDADSVCVEVLGVPPPREECVSNPVTDAVNNTEAVFLAEGTVPAATSYQVRVRAMGINGDGVPGNADDSDQDFALFVYNGTP